MKWIDGIYGLRRLKSGGSFYAKNVGVDSLGLLRPMSPVDPASSQVRPRRFADTDMAKHLRFALYHPRAAKRMLGIAE